MGMMDKFLNAMRLNSDEEDDYLDDDFYDDEEEYEAPKRSFKRQPKSETKHESKFATAEREPVKTPARPASSSKVTPMRSVRKSGGSMEVCVIKPASIEDAREITETLLANRTVVLNMEGLDLDVAQRIIDFTSGSCFAVSGALQKISNYIFIVTPSSVDISGDFQSIMDAFDASSLRNDI